MQHPLNSFYRQNITDLQQEAARLKKAIFGWYMLRLFSFIGFFAFLVLYIQFYPFHLYLLLSAGSMALFLFAIKMDLKYGFRQKFNENKIAVSSFELQALEYRFEERKTGEEYRSLNAQLADDFEIFGKGSLFQFLNRCTTRLGEAMFAQGLCFPSSSPQNIELQQKAISELTEKQSFMQDFQAYGMFINENPGDTQNLQVWLQSTEKNIRFLRIATLVLTGFMMAWIAGVAWGLLTPGSIAIPIVVNLGFLFAHTRQINKAHALLGRSAKTFEKYSSLIALVQTQSFSSELLSDLQNSLLHSRIGAAAALKRLFKLLNSFDIRFNIIASFLLNALLLFDLRTYCRLSKWKSTHREHVMPWLEAIARFDALISYTTYAFNHRHSTCLPTLSENKQMFEATQMGHPIISDAQRVCNDFKFSGHPRIIIITGANMAGKSTFLRTLSVNLILAMNGAPVCARQFCFAPSNILSSIKIQDSLSNHQSYFYAELLRLKSIAENLETNSQNIVILDEILRGTNSADKQKGSIGYLHKLIKLNAFVIIATHDLSIGQLEQQYPEIVENFCFEVELMQNQLSFDYKLKKGISQKLNASFLMKEMKLID